MLKRHEIQVLRRAGHTWRRSPRSSGVSIRTVRRVAAEAAVTTVDNEAERARRQVGGPSKAEAYRDGLRAGADRGCDAAIGGVAAPGAPSGYAGGKSAVYALVQTLRAAR